MSLKKLYLPHKTSKQMKKITVIILLLVAFISNAQDVSMTKSAIFKDSKKVSTLEFS